MTVEPKKRGETIVLQLAGKLELTTVSTFRQRFQELTTPGSTVVVDLAQVTFVDSSGLSGLVAARERTPATFLMNARPSVRSILNLTNLIGYFTILTQDEFEAQFPK